MKIGVIISAALLVASQAPAQTVPWITLRSLEGKWEGAIWGKPGKGTSTREFRLELNSHFLSQRNECVFEAKSADAKPAVHEDFSMLSYDASQKKIIWRQFHSEGLVQEYILDSVSEDGKTLDFASSRMDNMTPGFRAKERFRILASGELEATFWLAPPGKNFEVYTQVLLKRVH